ncbi:MAG: hypothetical protein AAGE52_16030 [Myxococcota bacterium]
MNSSAKILELLDGHEPSAGWLETDVARAMLSDAKLRTRIYQAIHPAATPQHANLLRSLLTHEVAFRRRDHHLVGPENAFENLYWCALFLHQIGDLEDVLPLWRAKHTNFDTGCGFDTEFLVGAGVEATLAFLKASDDPDAPAAHDYVRMCNDAGAFDELAQWLSGRVAYFDELAGPTSH